MKKEKIIVHKAHGYKPGNVDNDNDLAGDREGADIAIKKIIKKITIKGLARIIKRAEKKSGI